jgi:hypothetical protein
MRPNQKTELPAKFMERPPPPPGERIMLAAKECKEGMPGLQDGFRGSIGAAPLSPVVEPVGFRG